MCFKIFEPLWVEGFMKISINFWNIGIFLKKKNIQLTAFSVSQIRIFYRATKVSFHCCKTFKIGWCISKSLNHFHFESSTAMGTKYCTQVFFFTKIPIYRKCKTIFKNTSKRGVVRCFWNTILIWKLSNNGKPLSHLGKYLNLGP